MLSELGSLGTDAMYLNDFLLTWEKSADELQATFLVADILRGLREKNISSRLFDSGLAISLFRDNSTRTRFSFASACNLLGLEIQDLDEGKSQIAHGETVREVPVGFKWVAEAMAEGDALVGGEESGGFTVRGHVREKDGVLMALLAAAMHADESLDERVDRLLETHGTVVQDKISVDCPDDEKAQVLDDLEAAIPETVADTAVEDVNTADGFKLLLADGSWLLVRPSGTEPVLRVYAEAADEKRVRELLEAGRELLEPLV